jgi:hypothetical protein
MQVRIVASRMLAVLALVLLLLPAARAGVSVSALLHDPVMPPAAIAVFEDPGATLALPALLGAPGSDLFVPVGEGPLLPGFTASAWWQRFDLVNDTDSARRLFLVVGEPGVDDLRLYRVRSGVVFESLRLGRTAPAGNRSVAFRQPVFELDLPAGARGHLLPARLVGNLHGVAAAG